MAKTRAKILTKRLKVIGYFDFFLSMVTLGLAFYLIITLFLPVDNHDNQLDMKTELETLDENQRGYLGFYASTMFLVAVGIIEVLSACMLITASKIPPNKKRKMQHDLIEYWMDNAIEVLIVMTMAWLSLLGNSMFNKTCLSVFTSHYTQVPYLISYNIKLVLLLLVWKEKAKFSEENLGSKEENLEAWKAVLGFKVGPRDDDVETGAGSEQGQSVGGSGSGSKCMTGAKGRRNRMRARRNQPKKGRRGSGTEV